MKPKIRFFSVAFLFLIPSLLFSQEKTNNLNCTNSNCHNDILDMQYIHEPARDECLTCHEKVSGNHPEKEGKEFALVENGSELCETCHSFQSSKKMVHSPFAEKKCLSCHSPHSSNTKGILAGTTEKEVCSKCHNIDIKEHKYFHGPFISNQCASCHFGHESDFNALARFDDPYLCFQCHIEKEEDLQLSVVHPIFSDGCMDCHSPHSSKQSYMLKIEGNRLCFDCHSEIQEAVASAKNIHEPLTEKGTCVSCHTPHAGELEKLLVNIQPELCFNCHSVNINKKERYIDIFGRLSKEYVHKPIYEDPCTKCHLPHISQNSNLLAAPFPDGNYTKPNIENFSMCFQCHDSKKITNKIGTDTNFRDGNKNLHTVHVIKKKSISCQSCHDMHGADNQHIIGNVVYFGNWEMPINYKVTETGGSCLPGCHAELSYSRE
ncbi:MAG: cytochrome c3 family protein [Ignavibacteriae bacterium]|nr:cytochrome c3 family protein [Ignavibacteriota bacterium]MCB9208255.1 cytochrome c3 family protein [Ignavibacteriales bacterium]MCB9259017.1 cytochrome c3 family protein [Ignavibacteriales bacterium]